MLGKNIYLASFFLLFSAQAVCAEQQENTQWAKQREIYLQASDALKDDKLTEYHQLRAQLDHYPLTPYLDNRIFLSKLGAKSVGDVQSYIEKNASLPFVKGVHNRYLAYLGKTGKWKSFLAMQSEKPRTELYRCYFYRAKLATGETKVAWDGARELWSTGHSVDKACDPLFNAWKASKNKTDDDTINRMLFAFSSRNTALMKYLKKQLPKTKHDQANLILSFYHHPEKIKTFSKKQKVTPFNQRLTEVAFKRLASKNSFTAMQQFDAVVKGQHFDAAKRKELAEYVARRLLRTSHRQAQIWRDKVIQSSENVILIEKRIAKAIEYADWKGVPKWIATLPKEDQEKTRWVFWKGHAYDKLGKKIEADAQYKKILGQRDFYSMSAAIELNIPITFSTKELETLDENQLLSFDATFDRIGELFSLEKLDAARYEWQYLLNRVDPKMIPTLAKYAEKQNWEHLGILATIKGKMWDYLTLRFPVAYKWWFKHFSDKRQVAQTTLMAIARQESALFSRARSPVGARGLMQLMPATARSTAKKIDYKLENTESLYQAGPNIRLGSAYLKEMLEVHANNRILAFASYNAGPHRVKSWLKRSNGKLDVYAFIDMIPFKETKGYVQNALMFDLYYQQLLGQPIHLLTQNELKRKY